MEISENSKSRESFVEIARGIGIILVVLEHAISKEMAAHNQIADVSRFFIYTVHMPLFIFLSGYLFEKNLPKYLHSSTLAYLERKFSSLMIPYLSFSVLNYLIVAVGLEIPIISKILTNQGYVIHSIWSSVFSILTYTNHLDGHLWFCYLLFLLLLINRTILKENSLLCFIFLLCLNWFNYLLVFFCGTDVIPDMAHRVFHYMFIFSAGRLCLSKENFFSSQKWLAPLSCAGFILLVLLRNNRCTIAQYLVTPCIELLFASLLLFRLPQIFLHRSNKLVSLTKNALMYVGNSRLSFAIYLLHMPFVCSALVYVFGSTGIPWLLVTILSALIAGSLSILTYVHVFSKIEWVDKFLFGNRHNKREKI